MKRRGVRIKKALKPSEDLQEANDSLIGVTVARKDVAVKGAAKAALSVKTSIAKNGTRSSLVFFIDLDENADGNSIAKAMLSRVFADTRDENALKKLLLTVSRLSENGGSRERCDMKEMKGRASGWKQRERMKWIKK